MVIFSKILFLKISTIWQPCLQGSTHQTNLIACFAYRWSVDAATSPAHLIFVFLPLTKKRQLLLSILFFLKKHTRAEKAIVRFAENPLRLSGTKVVMTPGGFVQVRSDKGKALSPRMATMVNGGPEVNGEKVGPGGERCCGTWRQLGGEQIVLFRAVFVGQREATQPFVGFVSDVEVETPRALFRRIVSLCVSS